jgi:hypothetical protein
MKNSSAAATVTAAITALAVVVTLAAGFSFDGSRALAAAQSVAPGDLLVYDVTLDVQLYALGVDSTPSMTRVTSGAGTETISIDRVVSDGTAYAGMKLSYRGTVDGRPVTIVRSWRAEVAPDGEIHPIGAPASLGDDLDQALAYINGLTKGLPARSLASGSAWTMKEPLGSSSGSMIIKSKVTGVQQYGGHRAFVIEQNGSGAFTQSVNGTQGVGSVAMGGTVYYDDADRLLIGGAARGQTEMALANADISHISATTTVNIRLRSWHHAQAVPARPAAPASAGSATSLPSAAPAASPGSDASATPTPAYTPAPQSTTTPSPISTGN